MTSEERIKKQKDLIETMGCQFDKEGFQPITGRIFGLLIVMDKEQYTFDEIVEELKISKSSASNALRMLELRNIIEYITIPGDRKRYFQLKKLDKFSMIDDHKDKLNSTRLFLQAAYELKANKNSDNALMLANLINMLNFFLEKFEDLKKEYLSNK
jgi:DNA-binding transcriptional regulator GbsR (MarR family)